MCPTSGVEARSFCLFSARLSRRALNNTAMQVYSSSVALALFSSMYTCGMLGCVCALRAGLTAAVGCLRLSWTVLLLPD